MFAIGSSKFSIGILDNFVKALAPGIGTNPASTPPASTNLLTSSPVRISLPMITWTVPFIPPTTGITSNARLALLFKASGSISFSASVIESAKCSKAFCFISLYVVYLSIAISSVSFNPKGFFHFILDVDSFENITSTLLSFAISWLFRVSSLILFWVFVNVESFTFKAVLFIWLFTIELKITSLILKPVI